MNLGFFTMPIHPLDKDWRQSLREDREAFVLADELGFTEAYVGEHTTDQAENITSCISFLAWIASDIKRMRLGTGTVNLPNSHPAAVAAQVAMLDHMLDGRFNFGISPGGLMSDAEVFGNLDADRNAMFLEAIDFIVRIWTSEPPYALEGKFWNVSTARTMMADIGQGLIAKPLAEAASAHRRDRGLALLARRGRSGRARLESDLGEFSSAQMGRDPLDEIRSKVARAPAGRPIRPTGASPSRSSSPTIWRRRKPTRSGRKARIASTTASFSRSFSRAAAAISSRKTRTRPTTRSTSTASSTTW